MFTNTETFQLPSSRQRKCRELFVGPEFDPAGRDRDIDIWLSPDQPGGEAKIARAFKFKSEHTALAAAQLALDVSADEGAIARFLVSRNLTTALTQIHDLAVSMTAGRSSELCTDMGNNFLVATGRPENYGIALCTVHRNGSGKWAIILSVCGLTSKKPRGGVWIL